MKTQCSSSNRQVFLGYVREKRRRVKESFSHWLYFVQKNKTSNSNTRNDTFFERRRNKVLCTRGDFCQLLKLSFFCSKIYSISLFHNMTQGQWQNLLLSLCYSQIMRLIPESESDFSVTLTFSNVFLQSQGSHLIIE